MWLEDHEIYEIVPSVGIDCKFISNICEWPLLTLNGRSNDGFFLTLFMAFMSNETDECFERVLTHFKSLVQISLSIIAINQSIPCNIATRKVFTASYIGLDEWYLSQNHLEICGAWCSKIRRGYLVKQMCMDLFKMRKANREERFDVLRTEEERMYFDIYQKIPPAWITFLYVRTNS